MTKDTGKARLPGLAPPSATDPATARWMQAVTERLEVREGARGNPHERALTVRDLVGTGLATLGTGGGLSRAAGAGTGSASIAPGVREGDLQYERMWDELRRSKLYRDLMQRIDDPDRFNDFAEEVKAVLLNDLAELARRQQADINRVDTKIQTETRSLAMAVQEVTAAVENAAAGVRSVQFAQATPDTALAGQVTQIIARLDGQAIDPANVVGPVYLTLADLRTAVPAGTAGKFYRVKNPVDGGPAILYRWDAGRAMYVVAGMANSAAIEQVMQATADRVAGLSSEYYVKLQAGGAFGGYGLSAHENADGTGGYSQFLIAADKFAVVGPSGNVNPFLISQEGGTGPYYLYLNGQVRINTGAGPTVDELADRLEILADRQAFKQNSAGAWDTSALSLSATVSGTLVGRPVVWTVVSGTYTGALPNGMLLAVQRAGMTTQTVTFRATCTSGNGTVRTDQVTVIKLSDGQDGQDGLPGKDALSAYLTNETHTVVSDAGGTVTAAIMASATGNLRVFSGPLDVTASSTFSVVSQSGLTVNITPGGKYTATAMAAGADVATAVFGATYQGVLVSKAFTLTRVRSGELADRIELRADRQAFKQNSDGSWDAATATLTVDRSGTLVSSPVAWSVASGTYTGSLGSGTSLTVQRTGLLTEAVTFRAAVQSASGAAHTDQITLMRLAVGQKGDTGGPGPPGPGGLSGYLTNETHTVAADTKGAIVPGGLAGAGGTFKVFRGTTDVSASATFSVAGQSGMTATISSSGVFQATSYTGANDTATVTLRAVFDGATLDKVFTVTRVREGRRGTVTGYSSSTPGYWLVGTTWASNQATNDYRAAVIVNKIVDGTTDTFPVSAPTSHLRIGDTVTLQAQDGSRAETRYWSGSAWVAPGVIIDGNLLVKGSVSADRIDTYSLAADSVLANNITVRAANITGTLRANQVDAMAVRADQITAGLNTLHTGYSFGFGAGVDVFGYNGAGYFRSTRADTYGLLTSHSGGNAALVAQSTLSGTAGLFSVGGQIGQPDFAATICRNGVAGFFQYRNASPNPSPDTHTSGALASAALARPSAAGAFQRGSIVSEVCGSDANYGFWTNGGVYAGGYRAVDWLETGGGASLARNTGAKVEIGKYNRGATQSIWAQGGMYVEGGAIMEGSFWIKGTCKAGAFSNFTGVHSVVVHDTDLAALEVGDLCVDVQVVARAGVNETTTRVQRSSSAGQRGVVGVFSRISDASAVNALPDSFVRPDDGVSAASPTPEAALLLQTHTLVTLNGLGEGQVNVCGRGGDLAVGDLLEASSLPGKAQRQADDLVRASTIGRVREAVTFTDPDSVQLAACIYLCG